LLDTTQLKASRFEIGKQVPDDPGLQGRQDQTNVRFFGLTVAERTVENHPLLSFDCSLGVSASEEGDCLAE
jgi:hypothetical protein